MVIAVRAEEGPLGLEIVKTSDDPAGEVRLTEEHEMLARCTHPGVVEVLDHEPGELVLRHHGSALSGLGPLPVDQAAGLTTAIADVVESIHRLGVAHRRIAPDHIVVDERGRPRLCGFGEATDATPETSADDVAALGRLLDDLLDAGADLAWSAPGPRLSRGRRSKQAERELRAVAASAQHDEPTRRPTARQFAKSVHAALPSLTLPVPAGRDRPPDARAGTFSSIPDDVDPTVSLEWSDDDLSFLALEDDDDFAFEGGADPDEQPADDTAPHDAVKDEEEVGDERSEFAALPAGSPATRHPRWNLRWAPLPLFVAGMVLVVGVLVGASVARSAQPFGADPLRDVAARPDTVTTTTTTATTTAGTGLGTTTSCTPAEHLGPDADGDGCPEPIVLDERLATVGGHHVELGLDGDLVILGDWDCDGVDTPALLRPATGEVFVFPSWALEAPQTVEQIAVIPGAVAIETAGTTCHQPVVVDGDGRRHPVATA